MLTLTETTLPNADGSPRIVGDIIGLDPAEIDASARLRPIDEDWVDALGKVMLAEGQRTPVEVAPVRDRHGNRTGWRLVSGGHRHAAAVKYGIQPLRCLETLESELDQRQAEISENLWRRELAPLDRAAFVAEMHDVLRARAGLGAGVTAQELASAARWKKDIRAAAGNASAIVADAYGIAGQIADSIGLGRRTIENDLMLAKRLTPSLIERLRGHAIATNATQLRALARLDGAEQSAVADRLIEGARSVAEAQAIIANRPKVSAEDRLLSAFIGAFGRMTLSQKKGALAQLAGMLPAGFDLMGAR